MVIAIQQARQRIERVTLIMFWAGTLLLVLTLKHYCSHTIPSWSRVNFHALPGWNSFCCHPNCHVMVQVQTLATLKDWEGLEALAKEKKNVLPMTVYIAIAKANGAPKEATARCASISRTA